MRSVKKDLWLKLQYLSSMSNKKSTQLTCVFDRFEDSQAVLRFDFSDHNHQELIVAKRYLPKDAKEGSVFYLELYSDQEAESRRQNLARQVLEEILKGE